MIRGTLGLIKMRSFIFQRILLLTRARAQISHLPFFSGTSKTFFAPQWREIMHIEHVNRPCNGKRRKFAICMHLLAFIDETNVDQLCARRCASRQVRKREKRTEVVASFMDIALFNRPIRVQLILF